MSPDGSYIPNPNEDRLLPPPHKSNFGPVVGIIIIVVLMAIGGLYFWGAHLNAKKTPDQLPLIPGDSNPISTTTSE